MHVRVLVYPPGGRCSDVGGAEGYDSVHRKETEYGRTLHCYTANSGAFLGDNGVARGAGCEAVVGTGGVVLEESWAAE